MISQSDLSYLGGIIDGEGSILIAKRKTKSGFRYDGVLTISMTDEYPIKLLASINNLPYSIGVSDYGKKAFKLFVSAKKCRDLLMILLPYIRIKRLEAMLVLGLFNLRDVKKKFLIHSGFKPYRAHGRDKLMTKKILGDEFTKRCNALHGMCKRIKTKERRVIIHDGIL